jgi:predicted MFS family arabinose efflux permease
VTATLVGSAALTMAVGLAGHRVPERRVLLGAAALMVATGLGFAGVASFWPLLLVALVGTFNPSASDVSVFLPAEQALLAGLAAPRARAAVFARYNIAANFAGALGALASGLPELASRAAGVALVAAERAGFVVYAAVGAVAGVVYARLPAAEPVAPRGTRPLARSRRVVLRLTALFTLDSFGGGFVVQSLLVLWLARRFGLSPATMGAVFFAAGVLGGLSQLASAPLAARIGLVPTMVWTHLPANAFLILAGIVPSAPAAVAFLLLRAALSQMDVPARQAYVMALVPPEERAAAASVSNVPRSLAAALPPILAGLLLDRSPFGWPLVIGGAIKAAYDVLLLVRFRDVHPPAGA